MVAPQALARLPVFRDVSAGDLDVLCLSAPPVGFAPGHVLFRQGEPALGAFVVVQGHLRVEIEAGGRVTVLGRIGPGELIGESGLYTQGARRTATVIADDDVHALLLMPDLLKQPSVRVALTAIERRALSVVAERVRISTATFQKLDEPPPPPPADDDSVFGRLRRLWGG